MGERIINLGGPVTFKDPMNHLEAVITFNPGKINGLMSKMKGKVTSLWKKKPKILSDTIEVNMFHNVN
jgi:hypothetical protein